MTVATIKQNLFSPSEEMQMKYTLWMNHLFVLYIFFMPLSSFVQTTIFFVILLLFILRRNFKDTTSIYLKNPIIISFLLYFSIHILWLLGTDNFSEAKDIIKGVSYATYILVFTSFIDKRFIFRFIGAFLLGVFFSEITSYLISLNILPSTLFILNSLFYTSTPGDPSPYLHHSLYGFTLAFAMSLIIYMLITQNKTLIEKISSIFFIISVTINLFITGGRTGYLMFIIMLIILTLILYKKQIKKIILFLLFIIFSIFIAYQFSSTFKSRIDYTEKTIKELKKDSHNFTSSLGIRLGLWYYSFKVIEDNILFGVGTGDFMDEIKEKTPVMTENPHLMSQPHPHNQYITTQLQSGILGLILLLNIFYQVFKYKYPSKLQHTIAILISSSMFFALMFEYSSNRFYFPIWSIMLSISIANHTYKQIEYTKLTVKTFLLYIVGAFIIGSYVFSQQLDIKGFLLA